MKFSGVEVLIEDKGDRSQIRYNHHVMTVWQLFWFMITIFLLKSNSVNKQTSRLLPCVTLCDYPPQDRESDECQIVLWLYIYLFRYARSHRRSFIDISRYSPCFSYHQSMGRVPSLRFVKDCSPLCSGLVTFYLSSNDPSLSSFCLVRFDYLSSWYIRCWVIWHMFYYFTFYTLQTVCHSYYLLLFIIYNLKKTV